MFFFLPSLGQFYTACLLSLCHYYCDFIRKGGKGKEKVGGRKKGGKGREGKGKTDSASVLLLVS